MTTAQFLLTGWHPKPEVFAGCAIALGGYAALVRPLTARAALFAAGLLALLLGLVSPLDTLAHSYLFSAHMAQHLLLTLVVPPLLLLGLPPAFVGRLTAVPAIGRVEGALGRPLPAWGLATATMWIWHLPPLYDAALRDDAIHILQHLLFLATTTLFWWPILAPAGHPALLPAWAAGLYLFAALAAGSVLGIILAFAPPGLYAHYRQPRDTLGILPLVRNGWGLTPAGDQQLGGFLMWIPGGFVYSLAMFGALARWFGEPEDEPPAPGPAADQPRPGRPAIEPGLRR